MSKKVTFHLSEENYHLLKSLAKGENISISKFIDKVVNIFVDDNYLVDEFEMDEIRNNAELNKSLKRGVLDMKSANGCFVE